MTSHHEQAGRIREIASGTADPEPDERPLLFDRSSRGRVRVSGSKATELLAGMVSNDVGSLSPGAGSYACALTPKGRIVADLRLYIEAESVLIDVPERAAPGWLDMMRKYINPRLAPYRDVSGELGHLTVLGSGAAQLIAQVTGLDPAELTSLAPYHHVVTADGVVVAHAPELDAGQFELFVNRAKAAETAGRLSSAGAGHGSDEVWTAARVEGGRPEWGIDIDEHTLPQEANMDALGAISYTKGCYVGQEVVARIHFRGHVNRHLRGLRFGHPDGAPAGAELFTDAGKPVGDVRSTVRSSRFGPIALAMVRREVVAESEIIARSADGEVRAAVTTLPFTPL